MRVNFYKLFFTFLFMMITEGGYVKTATITFTGIYHLHKGSTNLKLAADIQLLRFKFNNASAHSDTLAAQLLQEAEGSRTNDGTATNKTNSGLLLTGTASATIDA